MDIIKEYTDIIMSFCTNKGFNLAYNTSHNGISIIKGRMSYPLEAITVDDFLQKVKMMPEKLFQITSYNDTSVINKFIFRTILKDRTENDKNTILQNIDKLMIDISNKNLNNYLDLTKEIKENIGEDTAVLFFDKMPRKYIHISSERKSFFLNSFKEIDDFFNVFKNGDPKQRIFQFLKGKSRTNKITSVYARDALLEFYKYDKEELSIFNELIPSINDYFNKDINDVFFEENKIQDIVTILNLDKIKGIIAIPSWNNDSYASAIDTILSIYKKENKFIRNILTNKYKSDKESYLHILIKCNKEENLITKKEINDLISNFLKEIPKYIKENANNYRPNYLDESFYKQWLKKYNLEKILKTNTNNNIKNKAKI